MLLSLSALVSVGCLASSGFVLYVYGKLDFVRLDRDEAPVDEPVPPGEPENFLIVGSDSREDIDVDDPAFDDVLPTDEVAGRRSDTILLARIDPASARIQMVSFPRDLWVPIAGRDETDRINSAWGHGRDVLINTIRDDFGIDIHHYVEIDFTGFQRLVSAIDGVPVYLDTEYRDTHSGLNPVGPGCVTLDGEQALAFARARFLQHRLDNGRWSNPDPTADLGRITRQQLLIRKALEQVLSLNPVANVGTLTNLLDVATDAVTLDSQLSNDDLRALASQFQSFNPETIQNYALPVEPRTTNGGAEILELDEQAAERIFNVFRGVDPDTIYPQDIAVSVRNGSGAPHQAADVAAALDAIGFVTSVSGDAEPTVATTVAYAPGAEAYAHLVTRHLTSRAELVADETLVPGEVMVITGNDFTTVVREPWPEAAVPLPVPTSTGATSTVPVAPSTTVVGVIPDAPPPGEEC